MLTGYQEFEFIKQGLLLGIENYLVKPVDEDELVSTIRNVAQKLKAISGEGQKQESNTLMDNTLWQFLNGDIEKRNVLKNYPYTIWSLTGHCIMCLF